MNIPKLLRALRKDQKLRQRIVGSKLDLTVSEVSRIERGQRRLRADHLWDWFSSLGYHATIVFWEKEEHTQELSDKDRELLAEIASALPTLPLAVRESIAYQMKIWKENASKRLSSE